MSQLLNTLPYETNSLNLHRDFHKDFKGVRVLEEILDEEGGWMLQKMKCSQCNFIFWEVKPHGDRTTILEMEINE